MIYDPVRLYADAAQAIAADYPPEVDDQLLGRTVLRNVSVPTLTPVLPAAERASGAGVIIAPGGGYSVLTMNEEGFDVARRLAERGIAAFVLKYRLNPTPNGIPMPTPEEIEAILANPPSAYAMFNCPAADEDAAAAVRLLRSRAPSWNVDPQRLGFLGFSAGAISALKLATRVGNDARPDFVASIYGPAETLSIPVGAPPLFGVLALDDQLFSGKGFGLIEAWRKAGSAIEFMLYERGGHGFGLGNPNQTEGDWLAAFIRWMTMRGIVPESSKGA